MAEKRIFDTAVQKLKYEVLKEVIRNEYEHCYDNIYIDIPKEISPGPKATMRCCIFKERAIVQERIKLAQGGDKNNPNIVEVIDIACDECPIGGIFVTPACRGCIVHRCKEVCPRDAIQIIDARYSAAVKAILGVAIRSTAGSLARLINRTVLSMAPVSLKLSIKKLDSSKVIPRAANTTAKFSPEPRTLACLAIWAARLAWGRPEAEKIGSF